MAIEYFWSQYYNKKRRNIMEKNKYFSGTVIAMKKLNEKLKEISKIFCKELEKLNKNQEKTK